MGNNPVQKETEQAILNKATDTTYGTLANQAYVEQVSDTTSRRQSGAVVGSQVAAFVQILDAAGTAIVSFGGTQYSDADANADPTGTVAMGTDGINIFALHTDTAGDLQVDVLTMPTTTITHSITGIGHGVKTVTTAGTDVVLAGSTACKKVTIQAQTDNTGLIAVGTSGVDATEATGNGIILYAGDAIELEIDNLADIYIDATVSGEGVRYIYFT